jgi:hypothetical protein
MIPREESTRISEILSRLGIQLGQNRRNHCPIHRGDNAQAFSYDDEKGVWFCFRCGFGGDAIELVKKALDLDFKTALQWLGIEAGKPITTNRIKPENFSRFAYLLERQRELSNEFRIRKIIEGQALTRFRSDPNSEIGWQLLEVAYCRPGLDALEYELDELFELIPREAYKRRAA